MNQTIDFDPVVLMVPAIELAEIPGDVSESAAGRQPQGEYTVEFTIEPPPPRCAPPRDAPPRLATQRNESDLGIMTRFD